MKKNVVVIGSGRRAQSALFPALWCLQETHAVIGAYARTAKKLRMMGGAFTVDVHDTLQGERVAEADLILIAVPAREVPTLLQELSKHSVKQSVLLLDTPVLPLNRLDAARYFGNFTRVLVSEDTRALPPHVLARTLIDEGRIGQLKAIYFFHNGYQYHAAASLKQLSGNQRAGLVIGRSFYNGMAHKEYLFPNGVRGVVFEPRDYEAGKFLIEGTEGWLADYDYAGAPLRARLGYESEGSLYRGMTLDGAPVQRSAMDEQYLRFMTHDVCELSCMNSMKIRGLMDIISAATDTASALQYHPADGILDNALPRIAGTLGFSFDPRLL